MTGLEELMARTSGDPTCVIGVIDGPYCKTMFRGQIGCLIPNERTRCFTETKPCIHASAVLSILVGSITYQGICPGCTVLLYSLYESANLSARPEELANAIIALVDRGVTLINLSLTVLNPPDKSAQLLSSAIDCACRNGVLIVAASGNQSTIATTVITGHPWVIPVAASSPNGEPMPISNIGTTLAKRGVRAPGTIELTLPSGETHQLAGTSIAAAHVTGVLALLRSLYKDVPATQFPQSLRPRRRHTCVPEPLDVDNACMYLSRTNFRRG